MLMMGPNLEATFGTPRFVVLVVISILLGGAICVAVYTGV
jgi:membrane associated rhomboid family serine protease